MLRFAFGLLTAGLLWWLFGDLLRPATVGAAGAVDHSQAATETGVEPEAETSAQRSDATVLRRESSILVSAATGAPASSAAQDQPGAGAESGSVATLAAAGVASDAADAFLGRDNSFLGTADGRRRARQWIAHAAKLGAAESAQALTRLLEACMRGEIEKADTEARAVVDEAYATLQHALNRSLFDPANLAKARTYQVQPGEVLNRIAARVRKEYGLQIEDMTLALFNRISNPRSLRAGQVLKIPVEPIHTVVEKRSFLMAVYAGETIFRIYWIGHGKDDCTPETTFTVGVKQEHPDWYVDGRVIPYGHPDNVLGDYFVRFDHESYSGFGAHGTSEPGSIGTMASAGCIRMAAADIKDFFQIIPRGSKVEVRAASR